MSDHEINLLATTDAKVWAEEWYRIFKQPETLPDGDYVGWMIGWFANAFSAQEFVDAKRIRGLEAEVEETEEALRLSIEETKAAEANLADLQDRVQNGFQGGCWCCEGVGMKNVELNAKLRAVGELEKKLLARSAALRDEVKHKPKTYQTANLVAARESEKIAKELGALLK